MTVLYEAVNSPFLNCYLLLVFFGMSFCELVVTVKVIEKTLSKIRRTGNDRVLDINHKKTKERKTTQFSNSLLKSTNY